jgi:hypothetical protein
MADPANPSPLDRASTRQLCAAILEAVRSDSSISDAIDVTAWKGAYPCGPIHDLLTALAMEVELMAGEQAAPDAALHRRIATLESLLRCVVAYDDDSRLSEMKFYLEYAPEIREPGDRTALYLRDAIDRVLLAGRHEESP